MKTLLLKVCEWNHPQSEKAELQSMEGTLERKQKLQLGGKKVSMVPLGVEKKGTLKPTWSANPEPSVSSTLTYAAAFLSYFHRRPLGAGAATTPSYIDTPCASTRTERTR